MDPDHWRFTPSAMDHSAFNFSSFVNQTPGEMTPTHASFNSVFHNQAGDLHTPAAFQLGTPLSNDNGNPIAAIDMDAFHPHLLHSETYHDQGHFPHQPQQSYAPSTFIHRDSGYDTMAPSSTDFGDSKGGDDENARSELADLQSSAFVGGSVKAMSSSEKYVALLHIEGREDLSLASRFRFHVTLNAPTAMIKSSEEIPISYLNKGQAYIISINDSTSLGPTPGPVRYRTVIRISFEDEQQRQRPAQSWQLWKEGRGLAEAHQRGGKLQAVEYVDPNQGGEIESRKPRIELEAASFDCFSVLWSPIPGSSVANCSVSVRFNFLSTDFSHSKGVKGIPVRLCSKTEIISSGTPESPPGPTAEVCLCKVKLFRDHGAERKLSNDVAHIKKTIDKLKQQIAQVESGLKDVGKRKRSGSTSTAHRISKVSKHKRTWSASTAGSSGRPAIEDDLHSKLSAMQDMFSSTRPVSVLHLRGYEGDDPDAYPVSLPGEPSELSKVDMSQNTSWERRLSGASTPTHPIISPASSSHSAPADTRTITTTSTQDLMTPYQRSSQPDRWQNMDQISNPNYTTFPRSDSKISKVTLDSDAAHWINAFGVDPSYRAPPESSVKPVACFYVLVKIRGDAIDDDCYRAVYLMERTLEDLVTSIAVKCGVQPDTVQRTLRINPRGLKIMVDDEVVRELPEGQDMIVEFNDLDTIKSEPGSAASTPTSGMKGRASSRLELRLIY